MGNINNIISTENVWVIHNYGDNDIKEIFLKEEDAERQSNKQKEEYYERYRKKHKKLTDDEFRKYFSHVENMFTVKTLYQAIEDIKEDIYDSTSHDENY